MFDQTAAITGASEKMLHAGRAYRKVYVHPANHASYFPGAESMTLKVISNRSTGKLLGAQAVGGAGVDKRIDVLSVAIQSGMTVFDLEEMELAYSPQYGAAKDPVNMAGFVAAGLIRDDHPQIDAETVLAETPFLVDVRTPDEFLTGHIPGAISVPVDELRSRLDELCRAIGSLPSIAKLGNAGNWPRAYSVRKALTPSTWGAGIRLGNCSSRSIEHRLCNSGIAFPKVTCISASAFPAPSGAESFFDWSKIMLPTTVARVPNQTADHVNQRIREETEHRVSQSKEAGPGAISRRLAELDAEWDIDGARSKLMQRRLP